MPGVPYKDVVKVLLDRFPEFMETDDYDPDDLDLPYMLWGGFGRFITTYMRRLPAERLDDDPLVARVFDLANEFMDSDDINTNDIVVVELFENFYMYRKTLELARRKLKPEHLTWLNRQGGWLGTSDLHYEGELVSPRGLDVLANLFADCSWLIKVRRSVPGDTPYMEAYDERIGLTMDPGQGPRYSFFGAGRSWTERDEARRLLDELSHCLVQGDIVHRIALYRTGREDVLLHYLHHRWPQGQEDIQDWFPVP